MKVKLGDWLLKILGREIRLTDKKFKILDKNQGEYIVVDEWGNEIR